MGDANGGAGALRVRSTRNPSVANRFFPVRLCGLFTCVVLAGSSPAVAGPFSEIVAFDASLTDTGNVFILDGGPGPPYWNGRASNGPVWVEYLAGFLGVAAPEPSLAGGTNYAFSGASTGPGWPNIGWQIDQYLGEHAPAGSELFVLGASLGDFDDGETDPALPAQRMVEHVRTLAEAGATTFLISTLPAISDLPLAKGTEFELSGNAFAVAHNTLLAAELAALQSELSIAIAMADRFALDQAIMAAPDTYGFTNTTDAAFDLETGSVVPNPNEFLHWDGIHPTTAGHAQLAIAAFAELQTLSLQGPIIPEPSGAILAATGIVGLLIIGRLRRTRNGP